MMKETIFQQNSDQKQPFKLSRTNFNNYFSLYFCFFLEQLLGSEYKCLSRHRNLVLNKIRFF